MIEQVKEIIRLMFGQAVYDTLVLIGWTVVPFFHKGNLHWLFIASTLAIVVAIYLTRIPRTERASWRGLLEFAAPKRVFLHPSAILDYKFYVVNALILTRVATWLAMLIGMLQIASGATYLLTRVLGGNELQSEPSLTARLGFMIALAIAIDLALYVSHRLQHRIPILWEFHKVHHAPEVLTPITKYRFHPVDSVLDETGKSIAGGIVVGVYGYCYPIGITELTVLSMSAITFIFFLQNHLRHSHIPLGFGWRLSHWLCSPVMHQIHHSAEARHLDRNFSLMFSWWDAIGRTLYVPRGRESFRLGLADKGQRFDSVWSLYIGPFIALARRWGKRPNPEQSSATR